MKTISGIKLKIMVRAFRIRIKNGETIEDIAADYPALTTDDLEAIRKALNLEQERKYEKNQSRAEKLFLFYQNCAGANRRKSETVKEILMQTYTIVLPVLLGYIVWILKNQKKDRDANSKGTMLLLRVQMIEYHAKYTKFGNIPSYAYQNFCEMYDAYHALGGNGMVTKMKQEIDELHIKQKGE